MNELVRIKSQLRRDKALECLIPEESADLAVSESRNVYMSRHLFLQIHSRHIVGIHFAHENGQVNVTVLFI